MQPYSEWVPPPKPSPNGGLYTGPEPPTNAPWASISVTPDVDYMINQNLRSANPPPGAIYQYPGNIRPGNNFQPFTGLTPYIGRPGTGPYNFLCAPCTTKPAVCSSKMWCIGENSLDHCQGKKVVQID